MNRRSPLPYQSNAYGRAAIIRSSLIPLMRDRVVPLTDFDRIEPREFCSSPSTGRSANLAAIQIR
jgi:hypothetical protein